MEQKATLFLGPVSKYAQSIALFYEPTPEQIKNFKEMFGWEVVLSGEMKKLVEAWNKDAPQISPVLE